MAEKNEIVPPIESPRRADTDTGESEKQEGLDELASRREELAITIHDLTISKPSVLLSFLTFQFTLPLLIGSLALILVPYFQPRFPYQVSTIAALVAVILAFVAYLSFSKFSIQRERRRLHTNLIKRAEYLARLADDLLPANAAQRTPEVAEMLDNPENLILAQSTAIVPSATVGKRATVTKSIVGLLRKARHVLSPENVGKVAGTYEKASSTFLAAVLGGAIGGIGGVALGSLAGGLFVLVGPLGLPIGAAIAVFAFRGRSYRHAEKATQTARLKDAHLKEIADGLPPDAPKEFRDQIYAQRMDVVDDCLRLARGSIDDHRSGERPLLEDQSSSR